jgi:hypothetical protein
VFPGDGRTAADVPTAGDRVLYRAKRKGRDLICDAADAEGDGPSGDDRG